MFTELKNLFKKALKTNLDQGEILIYVLDDSIDTNLYLKSVIDRLAGVNCVVFQDEFDLMQKFTLVPPDIFICDINLNEVSGVNVHNLLVKSGTNYPFMSIFISSDEKSLYEIANQKFLTIKKPLSASFLLTLITNLRRSEWNHESILREVV